MTGVSSLLFGRTTFLLYFSLGKLIRDKKGQKAVPGARRLAVPGEGDNQLWLQQKEVKHCCYQKNLRCDWQHLWRGLSSHRTGSCKSAFLRGARTPQTQPAEFSSLQPAASGHAFFLKCTSASNCLSNNQLKFGLSVVAAFWCGGGLLTARSCPLTDMMKHGREKGTSQGPTALGWARAEHLQRQTPTLLWTLRGQSVLPHMLWQALTHPTKGLRSLINTRLPQHCCSGTCFWGKFLKNAAFKDN